MRRTAHLHGVVAAGAALSLFAGGGVAFADTLEGDELSPVRVGGALAFGDVCRGTVVTASLNLAIRRSSGGGATYVDGTTVTVDPVAATAGLTAGQASGAITIPGDWDAALKGTLSPSVTARVDYDASTVGAYSGSVTYRSSGARENGTGPRVDDEIIPVTVNVVECAATDSTPPVITPTVVGTLGGGGWYTSDVDVSWSVTDPETAITSSSGCATTSVTNDQSSTTYTCTATSGGGASTESVSVKRDATPPTVTPGTPVGMLGSNDWYTSGVTVPFTASDAGSGLADPSRGEFTVDAATTGHSVSVSSGPVADVAGNTASASVTLKIDRDDPTISADLDRDAAGTGWHNAATGAPTVRYTCAAGGSPIGDCPDSHTFVEGADQTHSGAVTAESGRTATAGVSGIDVDLTPPTVALANGPVDGSTVWSTQLTAPSCSGSDSLSGLESCTVSGFSTDRGTHTVTATATDRAGNAAQTTATYTVRDLTHTGFYAPVDMNGVVNLVKGGSTVPLKFNVQVDGVQQTSTDLITGFTAATVTCSTGAGTDEVDFVTTGLTALRYDSTGGQYVQNWKTPSGAGTCYRASATLVDGSTVSALFKVK